MSFKNIIIAILCFWATSGFAQNIKGTIKGPNGQAIADANVQVLNSSNKTISDKDGNFSIELKKGKYQIEFEATGFATKIEQIEVNNENQALEVVLKDNTQVLDEVVVSGSNKIETDLQKTPAAVSVLSAKKLNDYRAWNITDLTALAPSVFVVEHGNSSGSNFFNIRGTMGFSSEQSVATYVDGVYQFDYYSTPINFNNIERIEILRGPQGTLYGRNAFSGVVNIVTRKPGNDVHGFAEVDLGNYGQQRYTIGINAPIVENKLFFNISGQYNGRGSVYSNPTLNTKHFDGRKDFNVAGNIKYLISDRWQLNVNAKTENDNDKGTYPWAASDSAARNHPYQYFGNWDNVERRINTNVSVSLNYYGKHFNFTSITAGVDYHIWIPGRVDYDFTSLNLLSVSNATRSHELTQEFRFSSPANADRLKWAAGAYLFAEKIKTDNNTYYEQDYAAFDPAAPYSTITKDNRKNMGAALFGQATYSLTSKLDFTAGARYDIEKRKIGETNDYEKDNAITLLTDPEADSKTFNAFTPKFTLSYKLNDNSLVYASYAKGFRVGGFNVGAYSVNNRAYNPEKSDNYEAAIKNNLLQDRLKVNLTVFYLQQKNQQVSTSTDGINSLILNVGDMNNLGLETEVTAIPFKNFSLEWNAAWSHAKYAKLELYDYTSSSDINYKGNHPINNPDFSSMLAGQYNYPLSKSKQNISAFARLEYRYIGRYYLDFLNSDSQGGYGLMNARAGITAKNFEIAVWGRNINDARYIAYGYGAYILGSPRMYGITLTGKF